MNSFIRGSRRGKVVLGGWLGNVSAGQSWGPEFCSPVSMEKPGMAAGAYKPHIWGCRDRRILRSCWSASLATVMTLGRVWETLPQIIKCREKEEDTGCQPLASTCAHMCKHTHSPHTLMHTHIKNRQKSAMVKTIQYWLPNGELTGKRLEGTFWNCGTVHQLNVWLTRLCILL